MNWKNLIRAGSLAVVAFLLISAAPAFADVFTYSTDFENPSDLGTVYYMNGTAQRTTDLGLVISGQASGQLTGLGQSEAGSIIFANPIPTSFFDVSFTFKLFGGDTISPSNPSGFSADGITLAVFGGDNPNVVGLCCSGLGFANLVGLNESAFSIEFDTYGNGDIDTCYDNNGDAAPCPTDSLGPHISVTLGSRGVFSSARDQGLVSMPDLRNGPHTANIRFFNSSLDVSLDGSPVISNFLVPQQYLPQTAFVGITGSTGSYADYQIVDNMTVTNVPEPDTLFLFLLGLGTIVFAFFQTHCWGARLRGE